MRQMKLNGKLVKFYTIAEVAKAAGKTGAALRKLMERGLLPEANYRSSSVEIKTGERSGEKMKGSRLYSEAIYPELVEWLKSVKQGSKISPEMELSIRRLFESERSKIAKL